jgi:hypothetical protein
MNWEELHPPLGIAASLIWVQIVERERGVDDEQVREGKFGGILGRMENYSMKNK